ncbi:MAG: GGDEF domain-containing protein [Gemmatimonadaceae bacterium]
MIVWTLGVLALAVAGWWWLRGFLGARRQLEAARARAAVAASPFARGSPAVAPAPQERDDLFDAFRADEQPIPEDYEREDHRTVATALAMTADHLGAAQCVLWRRGPRIADEIEAVACARGTDPPVLAAAERARLDTLLDGIAGEGERQSGDPRLLLALVRLTQGSGALTAHFSDVAPGDPAVLRGLLHRHADAIGMLSELIRVRTELSRSNRKLRAMMRTAMRLQGSRDPLALERRFAEDALRVAGAEWAIVVRWDARTSVGEARELTDGAPQFWVRGTARQSSIVGDVCLTGEPRTISDTRALLGLQDPVFDDSPLPDGTGSLVVVALRRGEGESTIGALLCGHSEAGALGQSDATRLSQLGVVAAGALDTAWAVHDATERARTDQLTSLPNRRHFDEKFHKMVEETDRYGGESALVVADIDFFKKVNDTYGHESGDAVLIAVTRALAAERRNVDFVARIGGEEFALLLPQTDSAGALEVAERLRRRIEALQVRTAAGSIGVTVSFGIAMYAARSGTSSRLFDRADRALYAAKHAGRNRVELATADGTWSA